MGKVSEVVEKTTDRWIKIVSVLMSVIGGMIIYEQRATNDKLEKVVDTLTRFSVRFENHEGRISTLESDFKEVRGVIKNYPIKEKVNGR
jgi:hypothetical protein